MSGYSRHGAILGFAIAFGFFTLAYALAPGFGGEPISGGYVQDAPVPRLASKSEVFRVGESGPVWLEYYNPTGHDVTFQPPTQITTHIEYEGGEGFVTTVVHVSWEETSYTLKPGESFTVYRETFTASRVGNMTVVIDGMRMTFSILP